MSRFRFFRWIRKRKYWILSFVLLPLLIVVICNTIVISYASSKTYDRVEEVPKHDVGLVLGTVKYLKGGWVNSYFQYRIDAAVELFEAGKIKYIIVSGDNSRDGYDEPTDMKNSLIECGIPADRIYCDFAGFRTLDSMIRAKLVFGQDSVVVISQEFHNERAIYLAEKNGLHAIGYNAMDVTASYGFKTSMREYIAKTAAVFDVIVGTNPKFAGDPVPMP